MIRKTISFALVFVAIGSFLYLCTAKSTTTLHVNTPNLIHIGYSHKMQPIIGYSFGEGPTHLVLIGGMHGGYEANTVRLAYRLISFFQHETELPTGMQITVVPVANPDGLHAVTGSTGSLASISASPELRAKGRFNERGVDLNRNFDCNWQKQSNWGMQTVSAGTEVFSEPEAQAIKDFMLEHMPNAALFLHSKANGVFASACNTPIHEQTLALTRVYAEASGYPAYESFDAYPITGDAEGYLASIGIPAITVELSTHEDIEWEENKKGIEAVMGHLLDTVY